MVLLGFEVFALENENRRFLCSKKPTNLCDECTSRILAHTSAACIAFDAIAGVGGLYLATTYYAALACAVGCD